MRWSRNIPKGRTSERLDNMTDTVFSILSVCGIPMKFSSCIPPESNVYNIIYKQFDDDVRKGRRMGYKEYPVTDRLVSLRHQFLEAVPCITVWRALAYTEIYREYSDLPAILKRAKGFRRACETAPMLIQPSELIVGHPCGKPRAGAFSPDTA